MIDTWHREEPREVRPFFKSIKAEDALRDSSLRLFANSENTTETSYQLDEIDFRKLNPTVIPAVANPALWMPEGLSVDDLRLVLLGRHSFLKRSEQLFEAPLGRELPSEWHIDADVLGRFGGGRNLELTLALCLDTDRDWTPGAPFISGHWLAKKSFILRSQSMPTLFDVQPRSDEDWIAAHYPAKTLYAVDYNGGIESDEQEDGSSVATVYVHSDAYNKMSNSPLGPSLQPLLSAEILLTVLVESFDGWKDMKAVAVASPLATVLRQLGGSGKSLTLEELKQLVKKPALLRARLQDRLSVVQAL